jgi:undecaprenyl-diphosphatase
LSPFQAFILGIIQGITEFLPVSSSGHLVIAPYLLGWNIPTEDAFVFDVLVQVATLLAVFAVFWKDLWQIARGFIISLWQRQPFASQEARFGWYLILATIPAGLLGIALKGYLESLFSNPLATAFFLLVTSVLLIIGERVGTRTKTLNQFNWADSLVMGLFQSLAIFPGVSRSGSTITGGMVRNLSRPDSAKFSFLMSVPIMLAAGLVASTDLMAN